MMIRWSGPSGHLAHKVAGDEDRYGLLPPTPLNIWRSSGGLGVEAVDRFVEHRIGDRQQRPRRSQPCFMPREKLRTRLPATWSQADHLEHLCERWRPMPCSARWKQMRPCGAPGCTAFASTRADLVNWADHVLVTAAPTSAVPDVWCVKGQDDRIVVVSQRRSARESLSHVRVAPRSSSRPRCHRTELLAELVDLDHAPRRRAPEVLCPWRFPESICSVRISSRRVETPFWPPAAAAHSCSLGYSHSCKTLSLALAML